MPRRIRWGLFLLLVVVAFVAPGAARVDAAARARVAASSLRPASAVGPGVPSFSQAIVRQGVDLDDASREKAHRSPRRFALGVGAASLTPAPDPRHGLCAECLGAARRAARSTVSLRAPPTVTG